MVKQRGKGGDRPVIVVRREESREEGHHGGAWKIAYADFVTAMMAFFLLMWLINATTDAQRRGLADYFAPTNILGRAASGSGEPFGGRTMDSNSGLVGEAPPTVGIQQGMPSIPRRATESDEDLDADEVPARRAVPARHPTRGPTHNVAGAQPSAEKELGQEAREAWGKSQTDAASQDARATLLRAAEEIRSGVGNDAQLADLARQLIMDQVPEGLRIQVVDAEGQPVFAAGQAAPNARGRVLLARVASVVARLPNAVEVAGHTDASPFRGGGDRSNWDLSSDRAGATRRILMEAGISEDRIRAVAGRADRELLVPERPLDAANRRTSILVVMPEARVGRSGGASR